MNSQNIEMTKRVDKLSIVIPTYNEEATINLILDRIREAELIDNIAKEVIVVNDCSSDGTREAIDLYMHRYPDFDIRYFEHAVNQGKGAALHTGIRNATGEYLIIQDADLEYDPAEYNDLLKPVVRGMADVVYGSRFSGGQPHRKLFFWHTIGNRFLAFLSNVFTNLNLTDMETCYKLFRTDLIQGLDLREKRFGFEPEVTAKVARIPGVRIYEVGISYYGRTYNEGKKIGWRDGVRAIYCILKYNIFLKRDTSINQPVKLTTTPLDDGPSQRRSPDTPSAHTSPDPPGQRQRDERFRRGPYVKPKSKKPGTPSSAPGQHE